MRRRRFLAAVATAGVVGTAGCTGASSAGTRPLDSNPAARELDRQPRLGPPRSETEITLITFESPNCGTCAKFHQGGFQGIKDNWIDEGEASVYARTPKVTGWPNTAAHGLEAVYQRDPDVYWDLQAAYFEAQDDISSDNVIERTAAFLDGTGVDAEAVAAAMRQEAHASAVELDAEAAADAGDGPMFVTPKTWVFSGGEFVTTVGNADFETFESAVESRG